MLYEVITGGDKIIDIRIGTRGSRTTETPKSAITVRIAAKPIDSSTPQSAIAVSYNFV